MKWTMLCALLLPLLSTVAVRAAGPADLATQLRQRIAQPAVLRGEFEQRKQIQGFSRPLVSRGDFLVVRGRGIVWRTREPFANVLKLTRSQIVARQGNAVTFSLDAAADPTVATINRLLFSLLDGDVSALGDSFRVSGDAAGTPWRLSLLPSNPGLAGFLRKLELSGDRYVQQIDIEESSGDHTAIHFSRQTQTPEQLSAEERGWLE